MSSTPSVPNLQTPLPMVPRAAETQIAAKQNLDRLAFLSSINDPGAIAAGIRNIMSPEQFGTVGGQMKMDARLAEIKQNDPNEYSRLATLFTHIFPQIDRSQNPDGIFASARIEVCEMMKYKKPPAIKAAPVSDDMRPN